METQDPINTVIDIAKTAKDVLPQTTEETDDAISTLIGWLTTTHVVNYKNCIIVIKNVPCLECEQCGEKYYTDAVAEKLETLIDMAKKMMQEIAVIDYQKVA